jgi:hypothetical protein
VLGSFTQILTRIVLEFTNLLKNFSVREPLIINNPDFVSIKFSFIFLISTLLTKKINPSLAGEY